jgi:hypothetical protein
MCISLRLERIVWLVKYNGDKTFCITTISDYFCSDYS